MYDQAGLQRLDLRTVRTHDGRGPLFSYMVAGKTACIGKLVESGYISVFDEMDGVNLLKVGL